jgi:hypothetical protein
VLQKTVAEAAQAVDAMFTAAYGDTSGDFNLSYQIRTLISFIVPVDDDSGGESDPEAERTHVEEEEDGDDDDEEEDVVSPCRASPCFSVEHSLAARRSFRIS